MKKVILIVALILVLAFTTLCLSGCTLQIETTDSSVSASVDGDTTEKVDNILDWIKARLSRLFNTSDSSSSSKTSANI